MMADLQHNDLPTRHAWRPPMGSLAARLAKARAEQERPHAPMAPDQQPGAALADDSAARERADHPPSPRAIAPPRWTRRQDVVARAPAPDVKPAPAGLDTHGPTATGGPVGRKLPSPSSPSAPSGGTWGDASPQTPANRRRMEIDGMDIPRQCIDPADGGARDNAVESADVAELQAQARQARDELAAARRRGEREKEEYTRFAKGETVKSFIPVLDDLERALAHVPARLREDPWVVGIAMIGESACAMLRREGVERIEPHDEPFDPRVHEAIARVEDGMSMTGVDDDIGADSVPGVGDTVGQRVTQVYQPGYVLNGRVLRPALVQVTISRQRSAISGQQSAVSYQDDGDTFEVDRCHRLVAGHPSLMADG